MSFQVLARKLRPQNFNEVFGHKHISFALKNSLLKNQVAHAYVFSGTRGIGKTTLARIFAKSLCCHNITLKEGDSCGECQSCLKLSHAGHPDIIEIDGATHNGVDSIRQVLDEVHYLPSVGRNKVYIIDEVHMLSKEAFNALLKTLEAPPKHVIFILATTCPEKIIDTVLSRCQHYDLKDASVDQVFELLMDVAKKESIQYDSKKVLRIIAEESLGSYRDALTFLDQALSMSSKYGEITFNSVTNILGKVLKEDIELLFLSILDGDIVELSHLYSKIFEKDINAKSFIRELLDLCFSQIQENISKLKSAGKKSIAPLMEIHLASIGEKRTIPLAEFYWIYENLSKNTVWCFGALNIVQALELELQKLVLRKTFFNLEGVLPQKENTSSKKGTFPLKKEEAPVKTEETFAKKEIVSVEEIVLPKKKEKSFLPIKKIKRTSQEVWSGFLDCLSEKSPVLFTHLQHGFLRKEASFGLPIKRLSLGYKKTDKIFYDYLNLKKTEDRLEAEFRLYWEEVLAEKDNWDKLNIDVELLSDLESETAGVNYLDIEHSNKASEKQLQKDKLLSAAIIQKVQEVFTVKVDKVVLK